MASPYLSTDDIARRLNCSRRTVQRWAALLNIGHVVSRVRVFTADDIAILRERIEYGREQYANQDIYRHSIPWKKSQGIDVGPFRGRKSD